MSLSIGSVLAAICISIVAVPTGLPVLLDLRERRRVRAGKAVK